jgi:hypothetical protein
MESEKIYRDRRAFALDFKIENLLFKFKKLIFKYLYKNLLEKAGVKTRFLIVLFCPILKRLKV